MKTLLTVRYRAIQWDNCQGGSGSPFMGNKHLSVDSSTRLSEVEDIVYSELKEEEGKIFIGEVELVSMEIVSAVSYTHLTLPTILLV